jgi:preprotein translocase subunit SecF
LVFNVISFLTFAAAVFFLFSRGLHLSVEFTGGTVMEVSYSQPAELEKVRGHRGQAGLHRHAGAELWHARDVMIRLPAQKGVSSAQQSDKVGRGGRAQESARS